MSIQSIAGNIGSSIYRGVGGTFSEIGNRIENLLGGAVAQLSSLWDGGFVGFDMNNYQILTSAIEAHVQAMEVIISSFNTEAYIGGALKGEAMEAAIEYVRAIKQLLDAYATTYRDFNLQLTGSAKGEFSGDGDNIMAQYASGDSQNAQAINTEAQNIINEASNIRID